MVIVESFRKRSHWKEDKQKRRQGLSSTRTKEESKHKIRDQARCDHGAERLGRLMCVKTPGKCGLVSK